jgi:hypothetical protein
MIYLVIKLIHIFSVFVYGGFLFTDNLFCSRMQKDLGDKYAQAREQFMKYVRLVVPKALVVAVISGIFLISHHFGEIADDGLSNFQIALSLKAFFGLWLGARGILQVFFGYNLLYLKVIDYRLFW